MRSALEAYDNERRPVTAKSVQDNRSGGAERVIDVIEARAPNGFTKLDDVASHAEPEAIVKGYRKMAGFDAQQVNFTAGTRSPL